MIEMQVMGIALDTKTGSPIVVLSDKETRRALPIWIGSAEASAIIRQIENIVSARPMTHDLICNILKSTEYKVTKIEINDINTDTYYANIFISHEDGKNFVIDSRPSDAIAVALRTKSPIYVTANVIANGTISTDQTRDEMEAEEFKKFVRDLKPSDFKKIIGDNEKFIDDK
ncbi:MAG: bifunctional nuclease family protein [bacterium]